MFLSFASFCHIRTSIYFISTLPSLSGASWMGPGRFSSFNLLRSSSSFCATAEREIECILFLHTNRMLWQWLMIMAGNWKFAKGMLLNDYFRHYLKAGIHYTILANFPPLVNARCRKSESVCRFGEFWVFDWPNTVHKSTYQQIPTLIKHICLFIMCFSIS